VHRHCNHGAPQISYNPPQQPRCKSQKLHSLESHPPHSNLIQEYIHRPTAPADWWPSDPQILGGRDLHRPEHGTWLGVTKQGRLAVLTNFREDQSALVQGRRSRGVMVNEYLRMPPASGDSSKVVARRLIEEGLSGVGGFSLMFGQLRRPGWGVEGEWDDSVWSGLAIVSNRSAHVDDVRWLCGAPGETHALSNSHYGDDTWPKVVSAEKLVKEAVQVSDGQEESEDELMARLLGILSLDTLRGQRKEEGWAEYLGQLCTSIFVPAIGTDKRMGLPMAAGTDQESWGVYGTQKQTVMLVDWQGKVHYLERTLFDEEGRPIPRGKGDRSYKFEVEGWAS
jgi:uncharacterized protein with NRDE domain